MIPYNYDCNDGKHLMSQGFSSAAGQSYESYLKVFPAFIPFGEQRLCSVEYV